MGIASLSRVETTKLLVPHRSQAMEKSRIITEALGDPVSTIVHTGHVCVSTVLYVILSAAHAGPNIRILLPHNAQMKTATASDLNRRDLGLPLRRVRRRLP